MEKKENRQTGGEQRERVGINSAPHEEEPSFLRAGLRASWAMFSVVSLSQLSGFSQ